MRRFFMIAGAIIALFIAWPSANAWLVQSGSSAPSSTVQVISALVGNVSNGGQRFWDMASTDGNPLASAAPSMIWPVSGTVSNLHVYAITQPSSGTWTVSLDNNHSGTFSPSIQCNITSSVNPCTPAGTTSFSVVAGDKTTFDTNPAGSPSANSYFSFSFDFTPTNAGDTVLYVSDYFNGVSLSKTAENWQSFQNVSSGSASNSIGVAYLTEGGTLSNLYVFSNTPAAGSYKYNLTLNTTDQSCNATISGAGTSANDTTCTATVTAGQYGNFSATPTSPTNAASPVLGVRFVPTTSGHFLIISANTSSPSLTTGTAFWPLNQGAGAVFPCATEANCKTISNQMTVTQMDVNQPAPVGASVTRTYTLRDGGANTTMSCAITGAVSQHCCVNSGGTGGCSTGANVSVSTSDLLDVADVVTGGTASATDPKITFIAHR